MLFVRERWRVAVLDSGLRDLQPQRGLTAAVGPDAGLDAASRELVLPDPVAACRFVDDGQFVHCSALVPDPLGHGTAVAEVICGTGDAARRCDLLIGQVLDHRGVTTAAALAAAIHWSVREGAHLIHMSLGLREDRQILAEAVAAAISAGCILVVSTPARGEGTYPARYAGVIRATGDARCQRDEISDLHSAQADFGGCTRYGVRPDSHARPPAGGASFGAAHVTHFLVEYADPGLGADLIRARLSELARYAGVEVRGHGAAALAADGPVM